MEASELKSNIESVRERVERAAARAGRRVTLVAATKTVDADTINKAVELGLDIVGENRVQEYLAKRDAVRGAVWHFIGTLQRNKAKYLVGSVALIQSVSSAELADEIQRLASKRGIVQDVLAEVNAAGEPDKTGAARGSFEALLDYIGSLKNVRLRGIMAVPPIGAGAEVYKDIAGLYYKRAGGDFDTLSVGMSGDFERAIEYGSNTVRIGTSIFGQRNTGR